MINGTAHWDDRSRYYTQSNNAVERLLTRYRAVVSAVSCGPSSAINAIAAMGGDVESVTPAGWQPQPEDVLTLWFNDHRNWAQLANIRAETDPKTTKYAPHEVPQYYPAALRAVFGATAVFAWGVSFDVAAEYVQNGMAVIVNIKPNKTGHFVAVVAHDDKANELIYHDPWPENVPGHDGWGLRLSPAMWAGEVEPYAIVIEEVRS